MSTSNRANRVFGDILVDEGDSLCYSPSPVAFSRFKQAEDNKQKSKAFPFPETDVNLVKNNKAATNGPIGDSLDKENQNENVGVTKLKRIGVPPKSRKHDTGKSGKRKAQNKRNDGIMGSPLKRAMMQKTQDAVESAAKSVNKSLNAVWEAKEKVEKEKMDEAGRIREQRRAEKAEMQAFIAETENMKREALGMQRQISTHLGKAKASRELAKQESRREELMQDSYFKSEVYRDHQQESRKTEERRRRMSVEVKRNIFKENLKGKETMRLASIEEDKIIYEQRNIMSKATREAKRDYAEKRRRSFAFRNGDARRIRELHSEMEEKTLEEEHASYELKWAGEKDVEEYKRQMAQERRDSLSFRGEEFVRARNVMEQIKADDKMDDHLNLELKRAGEKDVETYKNQLAQERRDSLAFRGEEFLKGRVAIEDIKAEEKIDDHLSIELKRAGEKDVEAYKEKMAQERRDSLAFRGEEYLGARDAISQIESDNKMDEHLSFELKRAGEKDVEEYKKSLAQERRDSFAFRGEDFLRARDATSQIESDNKMDEHLSFELKRAGEKDVEKYKQLMVEERRASFARRNEQGHHHREVMEELKTLAREQDAESFVLKWAGEDDVKEYKAQQEEERRNSLAFRNQEGRRHRALDEEMHQKCIQEGHDNEILKAAGHRDIENYRKECKTRDRTSLVFRRKEAFVHRIEAEIQQEKEKEVEHESYELDAAGRRDVEEYAKECKKRRRLSLAFRATEKRRHAEWDKEQTRAEIEQRSHDTTLRAMDRLYIERAKMKERARVAMLAMRHSGSNSMMNPFATLLE